MTRPISSTLFFFHDTATTEIYTLSLHDALPICRSRLKGKRQTSGRKTSRRAPASRSSRTNRSEEHTSELQSHHDLVCRLLLEKKKQLQGLGTDERQDDDHSSGESQHQRLQHHLH